MAGRHTLEEEFREFVAARSAALLRTAYLLAGDWATAEDLLQTALTKTYLAWRRLGGIEAVEPYARRVLVNTATSWWRRRWHGERPTEALPELPAPDQFEEQLERDALWRHVRTLPARQRAILVLRFYEDMTEVQAAAMLNISPGTVKSQTSRALATLRRRLGVPIASPARVAPSPPPPARVAPPPPPLPSPARGATARTRLVPAPAAEPAMMHRTGADHVGWAGTSGASATAPDGGTAPRTVPAVDPVDAATVGAEHR